MRIHPRHWLVLGAVICSAVLGSCQSIAYKPVDGGSAVAGKTYSLDKDGYIRNWLVLAPIYYGSAYNSDEIEKDQLPNEGRLTPKAGDKQRVETVDPDVDQDKFLSKELTWQPVETKESILDFNEWLGLDGSQAVGGYAVAYLVAPEEIKDVTLSIGSNDSGKIFLNGERVWGLVVARALEADSDVAEHLTLKKGVNVLMFKVWNDASNWQGCVRVLHKDGTPVTSVKVQLSK